MNIMKFGGTSVGSPERIKKVAELICRENRPFVVLSAMSGTTNTLLEVAGYLLNRNQEGAIDTLTSLEAKYEGVVSRLYGTDAAREKAGQYVKDVLDYLKTFTKKLFTSTQEKILVAQGELLSTHLMYFYLEEKGVKVVLLPALDFMKLNQQGEPDSDFISSSLAPLVAEHPEAEVFLTQGFICKNAQDEIDNLQRGGSDYTASLVGAALNAEEIQIWTDIDGMHNVDPRVVRDSRPVRHLQFEEAAELAYFGAKILHPTCIQPAKFANIPVRLLNTMNPDAEGTLIDNNPDHGVIKAVAAKDNIVAIKIKSSRMLLAHGFLRRVFEIFESYRTPIDMICTSEVGVSMTIDDTTHLSSIIHDLKRYGTVSVDLDMCIVCVVGDMEWENVGFESRVLDAMKDIPVRMISYGGSNYNISFLLKEEDKKRAMEALRRNLFEKC
ncbi:MAG: aspartate kinase [Bacteroidales bacterium]|nr:aspartate kinase [Bacteroidales bacterium]